MDAEPVIVPGATTALAAQDEFFLRYRLPWFPVTDAAGRVLGLLREERVDGAVASGQPTLTAGELLEDGADLDARVPRDTPLESLLGSEALRRIGALVVTNADGHVAGLITLERVRRALAANVELRRGGPRAARCPAAGARRARARRPAAAAARRRPTRPARSPRRRRPARRRAAWPTPRRRPSPAPACPSAPGATAGAPRPSGPGSGAR